MGSFAAYIYFKPTFKDEITEFTVYENPVVAKNPSVTPIAPLNLNQPKPPREPVPAVESRAVFGLSKNAVTDDSAAGDDSMVSVKKGNTLAVAPDDKKLTDEDADSLPIPTDDYLVTSMASIVEQFQIPYPEEARRKSIEGPVAMDLLIDAQGNVREASLIRGPGYGLNEAALEAVRKFKFKPARVKDTPVAVRIRYTYRFVLE